MDTTGRQLHSIFSANAGWLNRIWQALPRLRMQKAVRRLRLCEMRLARREASGSCRGV